jgi:hypothetical protein
MPGKNQTKRKNKNIQHAKFVWTRKAVGAANAWAGIKEALTLIEEHKGELEQADLDLIHAHAEEQRTNIRDTLVGATEVLYSQIGKEDADVHIAGFLPESIQKQLVELA